MRLYATLATWSLLTAQLAMGHPGSGTRVTDRRDTDLVEITTTTTYQATTPTTTQNPPTTTTPNILCDSSYQCYKPIVTVKSKVFELTRTVCGQSPVSGSYEVHQATTLDGGLSACQAIQKCAESAANQAQSDFLLYIGPFDSSPRWFCNTGKYDKNAKYSTSQYWTGETYQYNGKA